MNTKKLSALEAINLVDFLIDKKVALGKMKKHFNHEVLVVFFCGDNIIVNNKKEGNLSNLVYQNFILVKYAYITSDLIVLKGEIKFTKNEMLNAGLSFCSVKSFVLNYTFDLTQNILKAYHRLMWESDYKYCSKCGASLKKTHLELVEKKCIDCNHLYFPKFSPAVIVLIKNDNKILLARSPHFPEGIFGAIAGFIESGETAEMAVHREVAEEVGIKIKNLKYVATEFWPFPDNFMIAFVADYLSGEITINKDELEEARWFTLDNLPKLPGAISVASKLLNAVKQEATTFA